MPRREVSIATSFDYGVPIETQLSLIARAGFTCIPGEGFIDWDALCDLLRASPLRRIFCSEEDADEPRVARPGRRCPDPARG